VIKKKEYILFAASLAAIAAFAVFLSRSDTVARIFFFDTFQLTNNTFSTDKPSYTPGDTVTLRLKFELKSQKKAEIRYFAALERTLSLNFYFPLYGKASERTDDGIIETELRPREEGEIKSIKLDESKRTETLALTGSLSETKESFVFEFPGINRRFSVSRSAYAKHGTLRVSGYLMPVIPGIGDSLEDYIQAVPVQIDTVHPGQNEKMVRSCRDFVHDFYRWYVALAQKNSSEPAAVIAIRQKPSFFGEALKKALFEDHNAQKKADEIVGIDFDPFLNSQDPANRSDITNVVFKDGKCYAEIKSPGSRSYTYDVRPELKLANGNWRFTNFHYNTDVAELRDILSLLKILKDRRVGQ